jgi:hypothetical protein
MCAAANIHDSSWFSYAQVQMKPTSLPASFFNPKMMNGFRRNVTYIEGSALKLSGQINLAPAVLM